MDDAMKTRTWLGLLLVLAMMALGCKKESPDDPDDTPDAPETSLTFACKDTAGGIQGVLVGISPLQSDRDAGIFLHSGDTDGLGKIKFENLAPQKFYYSCSRTVPGGVVTKKGDVDVEKDVKKTVTVNF